ncbi:GGDEF domain-containing protein [Tsukamurella serpentis]
MSGDHIRALWADGRRVHAEQSATLKRVGLYREGVLLSAAGITGIAFTAMMLALGGYSVVPWLCMVLVLPALGWGARLYLNRGLRYAESVTFLIYGDLVIMIGVFVVTGTEVGFLKLTWLVAVSCYAYAFHGRFAMAAQNAVGLLALGVVVTMAMLRGDSTVTVLSIGALTVMMLNAAAALVIDLGMRRFGMSADRAEKMARLDELTGLLNRRGLGHACTGWSGAMTVAVVDLDGFKKLNDTHGHAAGDDVLRRVARGLQAAAGADALVARLGGDEFAVVVGQLPDLGNRIRQSFDGVSIRASVGIARGISDGASALDGLLASADAEMYVAKRSAVRSSA